MPPSRKTRALLAYLAVTGRAHRRERLCEMFWDVPDDPRGALRWSLSKIRALVDEPGRQRIVADRESVTFLPEDARLDVIELRKAMSGGLDTLSTEDLGRWADAFAGEFLEGLDLPDQHAFHAWCLAEREEARKRRVELLMALVGRLAGNPEAAIPRARKLCEIEPHREEHWSRLVRLLAAAGRRREAEEQCALAFRVLDDQGAPPAGALLKVARNLSKTAITEARREDRPSGPRIDGVAPTGDADDKPSIIVLPFRGDCADGSQDFFADGITEDLTTLLSRVLGLRVVARDSALTFKDSREPASDIAHKLGVRYALHGSVRTAGNRVRVNAYVVDSNDGREVWSERYDQPCEDVFAVQDRITTEVMRALQVELLEGEQAKIWHHSTSSVEAWSLLTEGLIHYKLQTLDSVHRARALFERAAAIDPDYAAAWTWLAYTHWLDARFLWVDEPERALDRAMAMAERALKLDADLAEVHAVIAIIKVLRHDFAGAVASARKAVAINPNSAEVTALLAFVLTWAGEPEEAVTLIRRALSFSPHPAAWFLDTLGHGLWLLRDYEEAVRAYEAAIRRLPDYIMPRIGLAACHAEMGEIERARENAKEVLRINPRFSIARHAGMSAYRKDKHTLRRQRALEAAGLPG